MSNDDFRKYVKLVACAIAYRDHQRRHPAATNDEATRYVTRFWESYVDKALDFLALHQADQEARGEQPHFPGTCQFIDMPDCNA